VKPLFVDLIASVRPNFMKIAPIIRAIDASNAQGNRPVNYRFLHTGQHYDASLSGQFFADLGLPAPYQNFGVGSGTPAEQTGRIMQHYELALAQHRPDVCLVVGDVTSTMACAIVAKKAGVLLAHVEAGIRSGDPHMPEEINRIVTDSITDFFYTTSEVANANLRSQGVAEPRICFVGNTMIDSLLANLGRIRRPEVLDQATIGEFMVLTLHRPSNVDNAASLRQLLATIDANVGDKTLIFPIHPRTRKMMEDMELELKNIIVTDPMDYLAFIFLVKNAIGVITDSGGITEEATVLGTPCLTLRNTTERPETVTIGTNVVGGTDVTQIGGLIQKMAQKQWKTGGIPPLWDGKAAERIVRHLATLPHLTA
jgi:UDP-N-acetylglucosamine 2-epimerase (non-hydrolysing)